MSLDKNRSKKDDFEDHEAMFEEEHVGIESIEEQVVLDERDTEVPVPMDDDSDLDDQNHAEKDEDSEYEFIDDSVGGFFAHQDSVFSIHINPMDENIIASGGGDNLAYIWRADTGDSLYQLTGHTDSIISIRFSHDGQYVASGGMDGKVRVWKVDNGELVASVEGPDEVTWIDWHPKGYILLAGAKDSTIWMWQMPSGKIMNVFAGHSASVDVGQFTPDGKRIVTGAEDSTLIVWDPKSASALLRISGSDARFHSSGITSLAVNKESVLTITGSIDGSTRLSNLNNGAILGSFENHTDSVETVGFSNVLPLAATGSVDNTLNIWDVATMRLRQTCRHEDAVTKLQWHSDTPLLTTSSADRAVRVWDVRTGECVRTWHGHNDCVLDVAISRDGHTVISCGDDSVCLVFRM